MYWQEISRSATTTTASTCTSARKGVDYLTSAASSVASERDDGSLTRAETLWRGEVSMVHVFPAAVRAPGSFSPSDGVF